MGPSAIRLTPVAEQLEQMGIEVTDMGNVLVHTRALVESGNTDAHFAEEIMRACDAAAQMTVDALDEGLTPVMLGGDHSVAVGSMRGMASRLGKGGAIWVDAHADLNTPKTSVSGNVHGMPLAIALGACSDDPRLAARAPWPDECVDPAHTVIIAARDLDPGEKEWLNREGGPHVFTIADIDKRGISEIAHSAIRIASGAAFLHVSIDLDSVDPKDAPGVGTPVRGGLSYREAHALMEILSSADVSSVDVVEVNPVLDIANRTGLLAGELICSLFGKRIL
jgi:arginase